MARCLSLLSGSFLISHCNNNAPVCHGLSVKRSKSSGSTTGTIAINDILLQYGKIVRKKIKEENATFGDPKSVKANYAAALSHPSVYQRPRKKCDDEDENKKSGETTSADAADSSSIRNRGFCNWVIPNFLMVGQYPGVSPEHWGPKGEDAREHIELITSEKGGNINTFISLQAEIPPQSDHDEWNKSGGEIYLGNEDVQKRFPRPFTHYAPIVENAMVSKKANESSEKKDSANRSSSRGPIFIHAPIQDLDVPSSKPLKDLLLRMLQLMASNEEENTNVQPVSHRDDKEPVDSNDRDRNIIYLHCWGGRGRAGVVAGCLLSLIWPQLTPQEVLDWIQAGYISRAGASKMPTELSTSPQTLQQRNFVKAFVKDIHRISK